ncbi:MAG TPA: VWA domain-containing protein [Opitutaceae bacterium]|nr:VWA domain-containing protein [Opitutaceae bacterium]
MDNYVLHDPLWLLTLLALPAAVWLRQRRRVPVLFVPFAAAWYRPSLAPASRWPLILAGAGLVLIIAALARPQRVDDKREVHSQGYDIMLAIDLSGSMMTPDYEKDGQALTRLQAIKPVIQAFIDRRTNDRIGVVLFAKNAYTLAPLTFDHAWLARQVERLRIGLVDPNQTAIGDGLGLALTRLEQPARTDQGHRQGAFVVLLTDGANNAGALAPRQAADIARSRDIPIYTIGAGHDADLDEDALIDIADATGGKYFRAADSDTIENAFKAIDRAQKIEFQAHSYLVTTELFPWLAVPGAALLLLAALLVRGDAAARPQPAPRLS